MCHHATEIWNAIADGKKFSKGDKIIIHGFSWGLRVLVQEMHVKKGFEYEYQRIIKNP